jgi:hypothetical protein
MDGDLNCMTRDVVELYRMRIPEQTLTRPFFPNNTR